MLIELVAGVGRWQSRDKHSFGLFAVWYANARPFEQGGCSGYNFFGMKRGE
jgi:hypothetical protein